MADPAQLSSTGEERDKVPELPHGAYTHTATHDHETRRSGESMNEKHTHQHGPHCSHESVDVGFFDPAGVHQLGRTLSRMSQDQAVGQQQEHRSVASSSVETAVDGDKFSLEKVLQDMLQKCVRSSPSEYSPNLFFV